MRARRGLPYTRPLYFLGQVSSGQVVARLAAYLAILTQQASPPLQSRVHCAVVDAEANTSTLFHCVRLPCPHRVRLWFDCCHGKRSPAVAGGYGKRWLPPYSFRLKPSGPVRLLSLAYLFTQTLASNYAIAV